MGSIKTNNHITRFLTRSFILLILFSTIIFFLLGVFMNQKSNESIYKIGEIYMSSMNKEISKNFENVIKLRFEQVAGIVSTVSKENNDLQEIYEELAYRAEIRGFEHLSICASDGTFETIYGKAISPNNPLPFVDALKNGQQRVAVGTDANGNELVLFGINADYPMQNNKKCTGLVVAISLKYITEFLSLDNEGDETYYHIIRSDGSFVIRNSNTDLWESFDVIQKQHNFEKVDSSKKTLLEGLDKALQNNKDYTKMIEQFEKMEKENMFSSCACLSTEERENSI